MFVWTKRIYSSSLFNWLQIFEKNYLHRIISQKNRILEAAWAIFTLQTIHSTIYRSLLSQEKFLSTCLNVPKYYLMFVLTEDVFAITASLTQKLF